jgi:hypothetical protein
VGARQLRKDAVTEVKVRTNAVTSAKVANNALTGGDVNEATWRRCPRQRSRAAQRRPVAQRRAARPAVASRARTRIP